MRTALKVLTHIEDQARTRRRNNRNRRSEENSNIVGTTSSRQSRGDGDYIDRNTSSTSSRGLSRTSTSSVIASSTSNSGGFQIFTDTDNSSSNEFTRTDDNWKDFGTEAERRKENTLQPSTWTEAPLQSSTDFPTST